MNKEIISLKEVRGVMPLKKTFIKASKTLVISVRYMPLFFFKNTQTSEKLSILRRKR